MNIALLFLALATSSPDAVPVSSAPVMAAAPVISSTTPLMAETSWSSKAYQFVANFISSQTRMIQFAVVGMIIGLFIIIFTNKW